MNILEHVKVNAYSILLVMFVEIEVRESIMGFIHAMVVQAFSSEAFIEIEFILVAFKARCMANVRSIRHTEISVEHAGLNDSLLQI